MGKPLHREYLEDFADLLAPALALAGGTHTKEDVADAIAEGTMQFWPGQTSAIVTQIEVSPRRKTVHFFLAAGNLTELEAMVPSILEWAQICHGCDGATLSGRPGWQRSFLAAQGWTTRAVMMGLDFSTGRA